MNSEGAAAADATQKVIEVLSTYELNVLGALIILVLGFAAASWVAKILRSTLSRSSRVDATLRPFLVSVAKYAIIVFTVLAVLDRFGVETTSIIAVLGAAGLAIALAFQGALGNIAAGIMLLIFRPFKVGQYIDAAGVAGTVEEISLFTTELNSPDNVHIIVPNGQLWGAAVKNYSHNATRRADFVVRIDYGDDIGKAFDIIRSIVLPDSRVHAAPEPAFVVTSLGENAVELQARVWCAASDYWPLTFDLNHRIKEAFDAGGFTIPVPQRTVQIIKEV